MADRVLVKQQDWQQMRQGSEALRMALCFAAHAAKHAHALWQSAALDPGFGCPEHLWSLTAKLFCYHLKQMLCRHW